MAGRYRALLVDYGGVLTTSMSVGFAAFCVANGVDPDGSQRSWPPPT